MPGRMNRGVLAALAAAGLFGAGTPLAKILLGETSPWILAGMLYAGSGCGLWLLRQVRGSPPVRIAPGELRWLIGAIVAGGVIAPVLLMAGLSALTGSSVSLLLNMEGVLTALLAWFVFKENFDRRIALGMLAIVAGAVVLSWPYGEEGRITLVWPALAVLAACLAWAIDNNLTRKVALSDATWIAMVKGLSSGATNLTLAFILGAQVPSTASALGAGIVGFLSYGASLALFVVALRDLGTARTGAYFSVAPFFGAVLSLWLLHEPVTAALLVAGGLMGIGVYLHLTEHHSHEHLHEPVTHEHEHVHGDGDTHHDHLHEPPVAPGTRHVHTHDHGELRHSHAHYPDAHHRHLH